MHTSPFIHTYGYVYMHPYPYQAVSTEMAHTFMWVTDQGSCMLPGYTEALKHILMCKQVGLKKFSGGKTHTTADLP